MSGTMQWETFVRGVWQDHYDGILKFCISRLPTVEDAEEIAAESFRRLLQSRDIVFRNSPGAWLTGTARNLISEFYSRTGKMQSVSLDEKMEVPTKTFLSAFGTPADQEQELLKKELRDAINNVLFYNFPEKSQKIYKMRFEGKSFEEIAYLLSMDVRKVKELHKKIAAVVLYNLKRDFGALRAKGKTV